MRREMFRQCLVITMNILALLESLVLRGGKIQKTTLIQ